MRDMDKDIGQALESLASSQPTAPALHVPGRTTLTYADLGAQISYVRERLGSWGVVRGDVIVGAIPTRPEMALACATVPAKATFAPLSPSLTPDNYAELLTRLRPKLVIVPNRVDHPIRAAARRCGVAEVDLTGDPGAPAGVFTLDLTRQDQSLARAASAQPDWAYVLNTSGTTGRPKLVPRSHRLLALHAQTLGEWWRLTTDDVGCHLLPMHHGHGLSAALVVPLLRGASVVCLPESDIDGFFAALDEYRITWLTAVFTVHREILRRAPAYREAVARNKLRFIRVGSGQLEPDEIDRIERTFGAPLLMALSGREVLVMTHDPLPPRKRKRGSVGVPLCNQVAIMSEAGAICATGDVGEIVVRGPLVFEGYFDDAQATAAAFVDGWFRTGDLGRFDEDGYLYLVGRLKDLINRGGEKISPVEIDAAIEVIPGVREAATFAIRHPSLGEEIAAAVVKDGDVALEASDIIDHVRQRMGPLRVPRRIYFVDQLPRTDSGKVRRSELPRLLGLDKPGVAAPTESALEAPGPAFSPLEAALAGLWSTVLQVKSVGANEDFFLLGGDSLRGTRLLTSVKAVFGVDLTIQELFGKAATVAGMARAIENARFANAACDHRPRT
jgi:acyl-CoA synthetase (AMP-forming)/AMP-acid ligase II